MKQRKHRLQNASIRSIIFMYFTITALAASVFIGVSLYGRLSGQMSSALQEENHILINQLGRTMDSYLRLVMKLSDSLYYGVIKMPISQMVLLTGRSPFFMIIIKTM